MCVHCQEHSRPAGALNPAIADKALRALFFTPELYARARALDDREREVFALMAMIGLTSMEGAITFVVIRREDGWITIAFPDLGGSELVLAEGGDIIGGFDIRFG